MARSEGNALVSKITYPDLNMTQYPDQIDSRISTDPGYNENMKGFTNKKDYNMAEHVNALHDAVMALQRQLGILPSVDKDGVNRTTVGSRISILENKDYDARYGGEGWDTTQTLVGHKHDGQPGGPSQISLTTEVSGKLKKTNINLSYLDANGLTGADIAISPTSSTRLNAAINDKVSASAGGIIEKDLRVKGKSNSRFNIEADIKDAVSGVGTVVTDLGTKSGQALKVSATTNTRFVRHDDYSLEFGKYVAIVRAKVSDNTLSESVLRMEAYAYTSTGWSRKNQVDIKCIDFDASNKWKTFYMVFDYESDVASPYLHFNLWKLATTASVELYYDYLHITPIHPAVFDM